MTERCALWCRVSTDEQTSENQTRLLREWADRRGATITQEYVIDGASAFKGQHLPHLKTALADVRSYDTLLVFALDRLDRGGIESTLSVLRQFKQQGVTVASLNEPWVESGGVAGELLMSVLAWASQMESQRRSERVKAGLARRKAAGLPVGRQQGARDLKPRRVAGYYLRFGR